MKFSLLLTGLMVGLPKSSLEPGRIFTSRNDGPTHFIKSGYFLQNPSEEEKYIFSFY